MTHVITPEISYSCMLNRQATGTDSPQNAEPWTLHSKSLRLLSPLRDILSLTRRVPLPSTASIKEMLMCS